MCFAAAAAAAAPSDPVCTTVSRLCSLALSLHYPLRPQLTWLAPDTHNHYHHHPRSAAAAAYIFVAAVSTTLSGQVTTTSLAFAFAFSQVQSRLIEILWQRSRGEREPGECRGTTDQVAQLCPTQTD